MTSDMTSVREDDDSQAATAKADSPEPSGAHPNLRWALVLISIAQLMVVLDGTITNIALPHIQGDFGLSDSTKS